MIRKRIISVADYVVEHGKQSCRALAKVCGRSKSSIDREQQTMKARSHIPGAEFFETSQGQLWLTQLVAAAVFIFGIWAGIGSEKLACFFALIGIELFLPVSATSLKRLESRIDRIIAEYKDQQDSEVKNVADQLSITPGGDETFFKNIMMLVCMDLKSGFIFDESITENRDHKTWEAVSTPWLSKFKLIRCFLSDKAKALLKLAKTSLGVERIPDLFHIMNDVSKVMRFSFHRLKISTEKSLNEAKENLSKGINTVTNKGRIALLSAQLALITIRQIDYQKNLRRLSTALHPFAILSSDKQNSEAVEKKMRTSLNHIRAIQNELSISDSAKRLNRAERQIPDASKQVDMWWQWVNTSLESVDISNDLKNWLLYYLLPFVYWQNMPRKTNSKKIKRFYQLSMKTAWKKLSTHPLTDELLINGCVPAMWQNWAEQMAQLFIRTTSAIEGRNSWLSQMHFNGRGLSSVRVTSQIAIKNYYAKRADGTTACERLAGIKPKDMFAFIISRIEPLGSPRIRKSQKSDNILNFMAVPP